MHESRNGKYKLAVHISDPNAVQAIDNFKSGKPISAKRLLSAAQEVCLSDDEKPNYIVLKFAYVILDANGHVAVFSRVPGQHSAQIAPISILLASGLDAQLAVLKTAHGMILHTVFPFTLKLGAPVAELDLEETKYVEFETPQRFSSFAFRKAGNRYYAFFIHRTKVRKKGLFPQNEFPLVGSKDWFRGFMDPLEIEVELNRSDLLIDRYVLAKLLGRPLPPDVSAVEYTPSSLVTRGYNWWTKDRVRNLMWFVGIVVSLWGIYLKLSGSSSAAK